MDTQGAGQKKKFVVLPKTAYSEQNEKQKQKKKMRCINYYARREWMPLLTMRQFHYPEKEK